MPSLTQHYALQKLNAGDPFATNGQKYTTTDRDFLDKLGYLGAEGHRHNGQAAVNNNPSAPLNTLVDTSTGFLPASSRVFYEYTYVDPSGFETAPSPQVYVDLPAKTSTPATPTATAAPGPGTLIAGGYFYALSAYTGTNNTNETAASTPFFVTLTAPGSIAILFPNRPTGASGYNVYRRGPGGANYQYITSVPLSGATPATSWTDDGSIADDCNRFAPTKNTTQSSNNITVTIPALPPVGWGWNLYRTLITGSWANSFLTSVIDGSTTYQDLGLTAGVGSPPFTSTVIGSPSKIDLTAETTGTLPTASVQAYPLVVTFNFPGDLTMSEGRAVWICEFPHAKILAVRAALGRGSAPAAQHVIVDVKTGSGLTPTYASIFSSEGAMPFIDVGKQVGARVVPDVTTEMALGDSFVTDIMQIGGGATPTDADLTINIYLLVDSTGMPSVTF
jgi:hypothetical protein